MRGGGRLRSAALGSPPGEVARLQSLLHAEARAMEWRDGAGRIARCEPHYGRATGAAARCGEFGIAGCVGSRLKGAGGDLANLSKPRAGGAVAGWAGMRAGRAPSAVQAQGRGRGSRLGGHASRPGTIRCPSPGVRGAVAGARRDAAPPPRRPADDDPVCSSGATPPTPERRHAVQVGAGGRRGRGSRLASHCPSATHASGRLEARRPRDWPTRQHALAGDKAKHSHVKKWGRWQFWLPAVVSTSQVVNAKKYIMRRIQWPRPSCRLSRSLAATHPRVEFDSSTSCPPCQNWCI